MMSSEPLYQPSTCQDPIEPSNLDLNGCQKALLNILTQIRESASLDAIFQAAALETRCCLNVDRVAIFRFYSASNYSNGDFVAEAVAEAVSSASSSVLAAKPPTPSLGEQFAPHYRQGNVQAISDVAKAELSPAHIQILGQLQVQADLVVPLLHARRLWGLLCVHQCTRSRHWQSHEVQFVQHMALQLEVAIQQTEFATQTRLQTQHLLKRYADQVTDLYNNAPCGYHSLDEEGVFTQINDTELGWLGYSRDVIIGRAKFADLLTPESREIFDRDFPNFKQRGWVQDLDLDLVRADGTVMPVSLSATVVKDADGHYLMSRSTLYDMTNRKQAEAEIRQQQWLLRAILDNIPHRVWFKDAAGKYVAINQSHSLAIGLAPEDVIGKTEFEIWSPEEAAAFREEDIQVIASGRTISFEEQVTLPDGTESWFSTIKTPVYDRDEQVMGVTGISMDITDRKRIEQQLQASHILLDAIINGTSDPIFVKDEQHRWVQANQALCEFVGVCREEMLGKSDQDLFSKAQADIYCERDNLVFATGSEDVNEETITDATGKLRHILTKRTYFEDAVGKKFIIGIIRDITERKQAEEEARYQQHLLRAILDNIPHRIWFKNRQGEHVVVNQSFSRAIGLSSEALTGKTDFDIWSSQDAEKFQDEDRQVITSEQSFCREEEITTTEGIRWFATTKTAVCNAAGTIIGTTGISMDITDRKRAELAARQAKADLEHRVEERTAELQKTVAQLQQEISDRQKAEQALLKEREFLDALLNNFGDGIVACDENGTLTLFNEVTREFHGLPEMELPPEQWADYFDLFLEDGKTRMQVEDIPLFRAFQGEIVKDVEMVIVPKNGKVRSLLASGQAFFDGEGKKLGAVVAMRDITDRKRAEAALRESEEQLRDKAQQEQLLNHITAQIRSSLDLNQILGTSVQAIRSLLAIDRCVFLWYRMDTDEPYWEVVHEARQPGLADTIGLRIPATEIYPITEKSLRRELIRIDDFRTLDDLVARQYFVTKNYAAVLGLPIHTQSGEIGVVTCSHSVGPRHWQDSEVKLMQAVTDQLAIALDQAELYKQSRLAAEIAQRQADQLEETLQELQRTQTQMIQSEKMSSLGQLVAGVAHEINNPVNFIYGNLNHANEYTQDLLNLLQLYQEHYPTPNPEIISEAEAIDLDFIVDDLPKLLASMKIGAERIQKIVASLRTFSRMDEAEFKAVNIHEGIDSTLMILQNRLKAKPGRAVIEVIKEYGNLPLVECYAGQLNQVFMNILSNAIDAFEEEIEYKDGEVGISSKDTSLPTAQPLTPTIRICTDIIDSNQAVIRIIDNGPGMPEAVRRRIFDPFFTTKSVGKGTGMGMSISYQIITEKHKGSLHCLSSPRCGAEFVIKIPIRQ